MGGITPKRAGHATILGPGAHKEYDTCTCCHCGRVWVTNSTEMKEPPKDGWCSLCGKMICPDCAGKPCFPLEKRLKQYEDSQRFAKDAGIILR
jgi:hypothetical protein